MSSLMSAHKGSIPSQYYSTTDPESFKEFLSHCDVLVASLPSTPQTTYMLTEFHLRMSLCITYDTHAKTL